MSTDKHPNKEATIGPIVDPHLESQCTINSYNSKSFYSANNFTTEPDKASVVYLPLQFLFKTTPLLIRGLWLLWCKDEKLGWTEWAISQDKKKDLLIIDSL